MNEKLFLLETQKKKTNHILHLLLCIPTFGLWLFVWAAVMRSNDSHNAKLSKEMSSIVHYKSQGLSDTETFQRIKLDKANADVYRGRVIFVLLVVVFLYFYLR
ncbi:hypothetical protein [Pseudomonas sp.]|uniref:hypothetical protein n=1 Tax=Pseudomonas sp. TaxID=306 RepID=UPI0031CF0ADE